MPRPVNRYKAHLRDFQFLLFEQFELHTLLREAAYEDWGADQITMVLDESYRFVRDVLGPLNATGDQEGCALVNGRVTTPSGFADAWKQLYEAGWKGIGSPRDEGGQGAPLPVQGCVEEMLAGANSAFAMYPGATHAAAEVIVKCGTPQQRQRFAARMFAGRWGGTMCLTEPHAGSDVGAVTTSATENADGTYRIRGTKIFISCGDNDFTDNIVHLVLARIEGARSGTKGLSLFIVPRVKVNDDGALVGLNDVSVASLEHKMGLHASATCVLNFGENDDCIGELVGNVPHQGMAQMFLMMNAARIAVGVQGLAIASAAYLVAADYAKERKQGPHAEKFKDPDAPKVHIIAHADVRRMLLEMKSRVEGTRALAHKLLHHAEWSRTLAGKDDAKASYHHGQVELLTPLLKSYGSDTAFEVSALAIQVLGGAGFLRDHPVEQYCRDSKILTIYEGTNHIQALDLVGRKLAQNGGAHARAFLSDVQTFVQTHKNHPLFGQAVSQLRSAQEAVADTAVKLMTWSAEHRGALIPLAANRFLTMMAELTVGWLLLQQGVLAADKLPGASRSDEVFYEGKKCTAIYFALNTLPHVAELARVIGAGDGSALAIPDGALGA